MVPTLEVPPVTPLTCQETAVLELLVTVAVNCWVSPVPTVAVAGEMVTVVVVVLLLLLLLPPPQPAIPASASSKKNTGNRFIPELPFSYLGPAAGRRRLGGHAGSRLLARRTVAGAGFGAAREMPGRFFPEKSRTILFLERDRALL